MNLAVIIPVYNRHEITLEALKHLALTSKTNPRVVVLDNGSDELFSDYLQKINLPFTGIRLEIIRTAENKGVWPTFKQGFDATTEDILAYLHNDLWVYHEGWDKVLLDAFEKDPLLGLVGFVGSNQWDWDGGRGLGTMSNFQGRPGAGSPAEVHGARILGDEVYPALVVDCCAMVMRRAAMEMITFFDFPPHHFYDRLYSFHMLNLNWHTAVAPIACDHVSGQTANTQQGWHNAAQQWAEANGLGLDETWDNTVYKAAERRFFEVFHAYMGQTRKLIVDQGYQVTRY